jgi:hypothetical protein
MKATYGLASPQEFNLPAPFSLWTDAYAGFDVSKAQPPKVGNHLINDIYRNQFHGILDLLYVFIDVMCCTAS